jgi:hypothetical protein
MKKTLWIAILFTCSIFMNSWAQELQVTTSWLGNTFSGANGKWVMNYANKMQVHPDGTLITASEWDEDGRNVGIFKDGEPVALIKQYNGAGGHKCWGWGTATRAVAIDDNYLYVNNCEGDILRFDRANNYRYIDKTSSGIAIGMTYSNGFIYMLRENGEVQKRDVSGLGTISLNFTVSGGKDIAVDATGNIWILTQNDEILKYNSSGIFTGTKIATQIGWQPYSVNYDAYNDLLLVADNGPRRQVIKFNTTGEQVGTFGEEGGISSGNIGEVGNLRFWNISGAGTDAEGNIYVVLNENALALRKFNQAGILQWEALGMFFTDIASIDPYSDGTDIYGVNERMHFDYETQQWSLKAITNDRIAYPDDPRNGGHQTSITSALIRRVDGHLLQFNTGMYSGYWNVHRFDGEIAVFCQSFSNLGWATWPDKYGNIWYESGNQIWKIPLTGFFGDCPQFGSAINVASSIPSPFNKIERLEYDVEKDVMFIAGYTNANPNSNNEWGLIGSTVARYPNWNSGNRTASHTAVMPKDVTGLSLKSMSVANDYLFAAGSRDRGKLKVFSANDLSYIGEINPPAEYGLIGWQDIVHSVQAYQRVANGMYVILTEDNARGKNLVYQWCPSGDCSYSFYLKTPSHQSYHRPGADIPFTIVADHNDNIDSIRVYAQDDLIATLTEEPYQFTWENVSMGNYLITMYMFVEGSDKPIKSAATTIMVKNQKPKISLGHSGESYIYTINSTIQLIANAYDPDGTVDSIRFYHEGVSLVTIASEPFTYEFDLTDCFINNFHAVAFDNDGDSTVTNPMSISVILPGIGDGTLYRENFNGITGTSVISLVRNLNYPANPTSYAFDSIFQTPRDIGDNYGMRLRGYLIPPATGDYTFWISSDDGSALLLSTDSLPGNKKIIAQVPGWTHVEQWDKYPDQISIPLSLEENHRYYIEALLKEEGGGDHLTVAWEGPCMSFQTIQGMYLSPYSGTEQEPGFTVNITSPEQNASIIKGSVSQMKVDISPVSDHSVAEIVYYRNNTFLHSTQTSPFSAALNTSNTGQFDLLARGIDPNYNIFTSDPVSYSIINDPTINVSEYENNEAVRIYPNPWKNGELTVEWSQTNSFRLQIADITGRIVVNENAASGSITLKRSALEQGIYIIYLYSEKQQLVRKILVK